MTQKLRQALRARFELPINRGLIEMDRTFNIFKESYGKNEFQEGDLYLPEGNALAVICLFHGGFWKMPYGRDQMDDIAIFLARNGFIVWNIGYRRVGAIGGGCPGTFDDAVNAVKYLLKLAEKYKKIDLRKVILIGHSAGGQLAFWYCARKNREASDYIVPKSIIGLAPVLDLKKACREKIGNNSVFDLMGCLPEKNEELYKLYSPIDNIPLGINQLLIHCSNDMDVPVSWTRTYVDYAKAKSDTVDYLEIEEGSHMDFLHPESKAFIALYMWLIKNYSSTRSALL